MDALTEQKTAARREAFARRKAAKLAEPNAPEQAAERFLADFSVQPGEIVSGYRPIRTELDPTPLMLRLIGQGARLCVPVIEGEGVMGLARAFLLAGARAVVANRWPYSDADAFRLTGVLTEEIGRGASIGDALTAARRAQVASGGSIASWAVP